MSVRQTSESSVYRDPDPQVVARLVASHGAGAAAERWHWLNPRTLTALARAGRAHQGDGRPLGKARPRTLDDAEMGVLVEATLLLGCRPAERALGVTPSRAHYAVVNRGLTPPVYTSAERGRLTRLGRCARMGDAEAVAQVEVEAEHAVAVCDVLRAALALVPKQPLTGRYRLPPVDDALSAALAGLPATAVAAVFPALAPAAESEPIPVPEAPAVEPPAPEAPPPVEAARPEPKATRPRAARAPQPERGGRPRRLPPDDVLRADHAAGGDLLSLAARYGASPRWLYTYWRDRLGLPTRGRLAGLEASHGQRAPRPVAGAPGAASTAPPLGVEDLARAVELGRRCGLPHAEAVAWVRADVAAAAAEAARARAAPPPVPDTGQDAAVEETLAALADCHSAETAAEATAAEARYKRALAGLHVVLPVGGGRPQ